MNRKIYGTALPLLVVILLFAFGKSSQAQTPPRSSKSYVSGGMLVWPDSTSSFGGGTASRDSLNNDKDSLILDSLSTATDSLQLTNIDSLSTDSLTVDTLSTDSLAVDSLATDSLSLLTKENPTSSNINNGDISLPDSILYGDQPTNTTLDIFALPLAQQRAANANNSGVPSINPQAQGKPERIRKPLFSDSMSISKMSWISAALPGFGQIYNKQYAKLPVLYGTLGAGIALYANENKTYKPLKTRYDALVLESGTSRNPELDEVQGAMIRSNTRRQLYMGLTIGSYIYFLGDAAVNYSTNDVSDVKKATTLAMICPGAGQIYNKSYWKVPFVIGGFATMIYVIDWNNRGYTRFKQAYSLKADYDANPEAYPDGSLDEFSGKYDASYLKSLRDSYRRNRDLVIILTAAGYLLQVIDAHVDAHLKDFDVSNDLSMSIDPYFDYADLGNSRSNSAIYGFSLSIKF